jgi:hypothetical protein
VHIYAYVCVYTFAHALWAIIPSDFLADTNDGLQPPSDQSASTVLFILLQNEFSLDVKIYFCMSARPTVIYGAIISTSIKLYKSIPILLSFDNCVVSLRLSVQLC